jgi:hypothetical protein
MRWAKSEATWGASWFISYTFIWHTVTGACEKCLSLEGYTWIDRTPYDNLLVHPTLGPVWDLSGDFSLMHGASGTCRCWLELDVVIDLDKMPAYADLTARSIL